MPRTLRVIFIGAGFSAPAGLPLGTELFHAVRNCIADKQGRDNHVERDLARYVEYLDSCEGGSHGPETIDYEQFLAFLDTEHYLRLKGKDTWSEEGNESQLMYGRPLPGYYLIACPTGRHRSIKPLYVGSTRPT